MLFCHVSIGKVSDKRIVEKGFVHKYSKDKRPGIQKWIVEKGLPQKISICSTILFSSAIGSLSPKYNLRTTVLEVLLKRTAAFGLESPGYVSAILNEACYVL